MLKFISFCLDSNPNFLGIIDTTLAPGLLFYSYIPIFFISLFMGLFVLFKDKFSLQSKAFFVLNLSFVLWVANALFEWMGVDSSLVHFSWQVIILFESLLFISAFYFTYIFIYNRKLPKSLNVLFTSLLLPILIFLPTKYNVSSFDIQSCQSTISFLWGYEYILEIIVAVGIGYLAYKAFRSKNNIENKKKTTILSLSVAFFLALFSISNILGDTLDSYRITLIGSFGMLVFIFAVVYLIVKFNAFNIKLLGAQALVLFLDVLIASQFFYATSKVNKYLIAVTLVTSIIFGVFLVKSFRKIDEQKNKIAKTALELERSNSHLKELDRQKSEFVSFATHQLRAPLTAMKGYASMVLEGDYGQITDQVKEVVNRIYDSSRTLTSIVDDYLNISRIELGTMKYAFDKIDLNDLVSDVVNEIMPNIDKSKVNFSFEKKEHGNFNVMADKDKLKQVIANLIDNSIKYTPEGIVKVTVEELISETDKTRKCLFSVKDSGVGMSKDTISKLFQKFSRAYNANKVNIRGTGLGLYIAKDIIGAHHGRVWAESEGEGKGSQFYVELASV